MESYINTTNKDQLGLYIVKKEAELEGLCTRPTNDSVYHKTHALPREDMEATPPLLSALCAHVGAEAKVPYFTEEGVRSILLDLLKVIDFEIEGRSGEYFIRFIGACDRSSVPALGLFGGTPPHSNFFYTIVTLHKREIPIWFYNKYVDSDEERDIWGPHVREEGYYSLTACTPNKKDDCCSWE